MLAIIQSQMGYMAPVSTPRTVSPRMAVGDIGGTGPETLNKAGERALWTLGM